MRIRYPSIWYQVHPSPIIVLFFISSNKLYNMSTSQIEHTTVTRTSPKV